MEFTQIAGCLQHHPALDGLSQFGCADGSLHVHIVGGWFAFLVPLSFIVARDDDELPTKLGYTEDDVTSVVLSMPEQLSTINEFEQPLVTENGYDLEPGAVKSSRGMYVAVWDYKSVEHVKRSLARLCPTGRNIFARN